jgi:acetyl-CoA acetyltransferase
MYKDIVIVSAVRTPFGRYCGSLREYDYFELGALPMKEVLDRVNVPGDQVDEVFWGVGDTSVCKDVYTPVAARQTLIKAELPPETPSVAIDKACVSAMSALHFGCRAMVSGEIQCAIGGRRDSMRHRRRSHLLQPGTSRCQRAALGRIPNRRREDGGPALCLGVQGLQPGLR